LLAPQGVHQQIDRDRLIGVPQQHRQREKGGTLTGPNPVDRGKNGSKIHVLSEATGLPLVTGISAANTKDC
jgi:hypothetical protein